MNISKKIAATVCATALAFGGVAAAAPAAQADTMGAGIVDIVGTTSTGGTSVGVGVVVSNPWSSNEVLTEYHVIMHITGTIWIYDPYSGYRARGYVQRTDPGSDLAVIWIYKSYSSTYGFTPSDYVWETVYMASSNPPNGTNVLTMGDADATTSVPDAWPDEARGVVLNNNYPKISPTGGCGCSLYNTIQSNAPERPGDSGGP